MQAGEPDERDITQELDDRQREAGHQIRNAVDWEVEPRYGSDEARQHALVYCTALIMSKIGRYKATTKPPTTTPRKTIMTGSSRESKPETAASTSSS